MIDNAILCSEITSAARQFWTAFLMGASLVMAFIPLAFVLGRRSVDQDDFPDPHAHPYGDDPGQVPHG